MGPYTEFRGSLPAGAGSKSVADEFRSVIARSEYAKAP